MKGIGNMAALMFGGGGGSGGGVSQEDMLYKQQLLEHVRQKQLEEQRALQEQMNPQGITPDLFGTPMQQQPANLNLGGLSRDVVSPTFASGYTSSYMPKQHAPTTFEQKRDYLEKNPEGAKNFADTYGTTGTSITVGDKLRSVDDENRYEDLRKRNEYYNKTIGGYLDASTGSSNRLGQLERTLQLARDPDLAGTGPLTPHLVTIKQLARMAGIEVDEQKLAKEEAYQKQLGDEVMSRVGETKGAISEKEMELFQKWSANIRNSPEGNIKILEFSIAKEKRDQEIARLVRKAYSQKKTSEEVYNMVQDYLEENSLVEMMQQQLEAAATSEPVPKRFPNNPELQRYEDMLNQGEVKKQADGRLAPPPANWGGR